MRYDYGNLWDFHKYGPVCITTNGVIKKDGRLVMGAGIALQAKNRFPKLPFYIAQAIKQYGNRTFYFPAERLFSFPTKNHWRDPSDIELIAESCRQLVSIADMYEDMTVVYMTRPGCGHGGLEWHAVEYVISRLLDDRFVIVTI